MHEDLRNEYDIVGQPTPKKDGALKARGGAEYADDISMPGMLHGKLLRSPHPHAKILRVDTSRAADLPGVRAVITGSDFPGIQYGNLPQTRDYLPLAVDTVRYIGEEVAAVAAIDEDTAEEALELLEVEYEPLPAVFDPEQAMASGAPLLHSDAADNISAQTAFQFGDVDEAFAGADYVREDVFDTQPVKQGMLEPHACVGQWDSSGKVTLWACKMSPYVVWRQLTMGLGLELADVRIIQTYVGGGFSGGKQEAMPMDFSAVMLSKKTGRPVKLVHTMDEVMTVGHMRHPMKIWLRTGTDKDGRILVQHCKLIANGGAYSSIGGFSMFLAGAMLNIPYRIPSLKYEAYRVYTNNGFCGALRGHTNTQICFARDSQIELIAADLGVDALDIRHRNSIQPGDETANGFRIGTFAFDECIERVAELSDWRAKHGKLPKYRGIGFGCGSHISGARLMGHSASAADIRVREDGTVQLTTGSTDVGQGADTVLSMIAAEVLGVEVDDVRFAKVDTDQTPVDPGTFGSRVTFFTGNAVKIAAEDARRQLAEIAAEQMDVSPDDLQFRHREIINRLDNSQRVALKDVVRRGAFKMGRLVAAHGEYAAGDEMIDFKTGHGNLSPAYNPSACAVEVEVDPETGQVTVVGFWGADDSGNPLNPLAVKGQVIGATVMSFGQALYENLIRIDGEVMNPSLRDYKMPLVTDVPKLSDFQHSNVITWEPEGPFGAKEAGQGAGTGVIAAIANAIFDATGVRLTSLPMSPESILRGIKRHREEEEASSQSDNA
ncbi:MAG: molybdopterin-dependent oxidoreductase [Rhodospirillales bacterium]|jgi:4-hydroxybenzoyl-CoA reductase subunit alpha|nr:molybdopterin-dependent oxidoreductase [Rhodospirillales bacterium]MDP6644978.1 molybdopterin-dependent oxidoreductase [Rhodospirillales bacterium]MDP6840656.1 molybdopterin-dependent oxidoreductase [Rhodospirillales bacterium]